MIDPQLTARIESAVRDAFQLVKDNDKNWVTICIHEAQTGELSGDGVTAAFIPDGELAPELSVTCASIWGKITLACTVDYYHFINSKISAPRRAAICAATAEALKCEVSTDPDGAWSLSFGSDTKLAVDTLLTLIKNAGFGVKRRVVIESVLSRPMRRDYLVNFLTYDGEASKTEYIIADARHIAVPAGFRPSPQLSGALAELREGQLRMDEHIATFVTPPDATAINPATAILTVSGQMYSGSARAKQNYCVTLDHITNTGVDSTSRQAAIQKAVEYVKTLPGISFRDPSGRQADLPAGQVSGSSLCVRCGTDAELAGYIATMILGHLGYDDTDIMATTIPE